MSPVLVSLFLEDIELFLQDTINSLLLIEDFVIILLLFADDMAIFGKTPDELQHNLDPLHTYCCQWGIEVNALKTKIMVFRIRSDLKREEKLTSMIIAV
jgi:hypothetical protein